MTKHCTFSFALCAIILMSLGAALPAWGQSTSPSRAAAVIDSMPHAKRIDQTAISPDGTQVAYIIDGELAVMPANGGTARPIAVEGKLELRDVCWSRDSKQVAFIADLAGDVPAAQVFSAALDGSAPVPKSVNSMAPVLRFAVSALSVVISKLGPT